MICTECGVEKSIEQFTTKAGKRKYAKCRTCRAILARRNMRARRMHDPAQVRPHLVEAMGGKCARCGYDEFVSSLEFHHVDPSQKDGKIGSLLGRYCYGAKPEAWDALLVEARKCVLLCSNCHQALHAGAINSRSFTPMKDLRVAPYGS